MAKAVTDGFLDGTLDRIATSVNYNICTAQPTTIGECASLSLITTQTLTAGDFTKANGDTSGRKVTVAQVTNAPISGTGNATQIVIDDGTDWYTTTCTPQQLTSGGTVTGPAWDIEILDPV